MYGSCLCSVCISSSLPYTWDLALPDHCQSSAPAGGEHTTHCGEGGEEGQDRKLGTKYTSQIPHHFNKAISEGNISCNSNDKEKGNYFKSDIESCDEYISDNEITESDIREGFKKKPGKLSTFCG